MVKRILGTILLSLVILCNSYANDNIRKDGRWDDLVKAIAQVESSHQTNIVSDCGTYVGYLQISKVVVDDCNRILGKKKYGYNHRYDKEMSIEMFYIIQRYYNPENDIEKAIRIWNGGPGYSKHKTEKYFQNVIKAYNTIKEI